MTNSYDVSQRDPTLVQQQEAISKIGSDLKNATIQHGTAVRNIITENIQATLTPIKPQEQPKSIIGRIARKLAKESPIVRENSRKIDQLKRLSLEIMNLEETLNKTKNEDITTMEQLSEQMLFKIQEFTKLSSKNGNIEKDNKEFSGLSEARSRFSAACERETSMMLKHVDARVKTASNGLKAAHAENAKIASSALKKLTSQTEEIRSLQKQPSEQSTALKSSQALHSLTNVEKELDDLEKNTTEYSVIDALLENSREHLLSIEVPIARDPMPASLTVEERKFYKDLLKLKKEYDEIWEDKEKAVTVSEFEKLKERSKQLEKDSEALATRNPHQGEPGQLTFYQLWEEKKIQLMALRGNNTRPNSQERAADQMLLIFSDRWKELESAKAWNDVTLYKACLDGIRHILDPNNRLDNQPKIEVWQQVETSFYDALGERVNQLSDLNAKREFLKKYNYRKSELGQDLDLELRSAKRNDQIASAWNNYIKGVQDLTKELTD